MLLVGNFQKVASINTPSQGDWIALTTVINKVFFTVHLPMEHIQSFYTQADSLINHRFKRYLRRVEMPSFTHFFEVGWGIEECEKGADKSVIPTTFLLRKERQSYCMVRKLEVLL